MGKDALQMGIVALSAQNAELQQNIERLRRHADDQHKRIAWHVMRTQQFRVALEKAIEMLHERDCVETFKLEAVLNNEPSRS